ncbi:hypothetical protein ADIS_1466 [Lunatimonas lonarensis]|uniref:Uncharacterized protein n=1 Tax=Lunatimonas lonarensis TaxID=1232681 RepID=R7ZV87_9BACT|nr:hypothetical protein ADIS_1466 [Lunatimonas lonarensis]
MSEKQFFTKKPRGSTSSFWEKSDHSREKTYHSREIDINLFDL